MLGNMEKIGPEIDHFWKNIFEHAVPVPLKSAIFFICKFDFTLYGPQNCAKMATNVALDDINKWI